MLNARHGKQLAGDWPRDGWDYWMRNETTRCVRGTAAQWIQMYIVQGTHAAARERTVVELLKATVHHDMDFRTAL